MDETSLKEILDALRLEQSDNRQYEVKTAANGFPKTAAKTICAFANTPGGGTIIFGVDEKRDFTVAGVYDAKNCQQTLANYAQREYSIPILVDISKVPFEEKIVVVADVHEAKKNMKPVRYKKTDSSFIRQYDSDFELSGLEELMFESNQGIVRYDEEPISNSSVADLNQTLVDGYIDNRKRYSDVLAGLGNDDILLRTGVTYNTGELSVAGLLALGIYPQQHFPNYTIKASVRSHSKTSLDARAVNVMSFDGPIPTMLENALRWVASNSNAYTMDLSDGNVASVGEYPAVSTRELLANALIHKLCQAIHKEWYAKKNIMQSKAA
ncbi:MAG: putative DNA binding domain-containing protein [Clostridiales Family XIII bacterium]|jgi:ATP-dependent DNA helicase RecG|nr:putative DNA binding domain-containing protein [Clostridiales Family XIII bacterium]